MKIKIFEISSNLIDKILINYLSDYGHMLRVRLYWSESETKETAFPDRESNLMFILNSDHTPNKIRVRFRSV